MKTGRSRTPGVLLAAVLCLAAAGPTPAEAQQPAAQDTSLQRSQARLVEIRRERERLQMEMERRRGRVHSLSSELTNIERQVEVATHFALAGLRADRPRAAAPPAR